jgi:hypothetical protein
MEPSTIILIFGVVTALLLLGLAWGWRNRRRRAAEDARYSARVTKRLATPQPGPTTRGRVLRELRDADQARRTGELAREEQHPRLPDAEVERRQAASLREFDDYAAATRDPEQPSAPTDPVGMAPVSQPGAEFPDSLPVAPRLDDFRRDRHRYATPDVPRIDPHGHDQLPPHLDPSSPLYSGYLDDERDAGRITRLEADQVYDGFGASLSYREPDVAGGNGPVPPAHDSGGHSGSSDSGSNSSGGGE